MASVKKTFPILKISINGNIPTLLTNVSVTWDPALNPVMTQNGWEGMSQGAATMQIEGTMVIPTSGPQFNPTVAMDKSEQIDVSGMVANLRFTTVGVFTSASLSSSTDSATEFSFGLMCDFAPME